ncbi:C-type lectin domain family 6 member A-like isoform X2 [Alosa sapidissima]|uniref:C-type lectin domain family 6 member A-like isoform X2 n=1 Tax=Alosa sapidissima TaxID=34773 RepID=UPI001C0A1673|nr:C-type lectin domain family 6 member A-like isoform X2 [Alosa sapidissima]
MKMSEHPLYAVINHHQKHTSGKTSSETTDDDDATYSNIHISVPGRSAQQKGDRGSDCVIYTKVSLPNQDDAQPTEASDPDDPSPRTAPVDRSLWRVLLKPTVLLLFLSALLLIVIFTLSAFYALSKISCTKRLYALEKNNNEMNNTLVQSQSALRNSSEENTLLLHQLTLLEIERRKKCADGWDYFSGKCYFFSTDEKTWAVSRDDCVTLGGHLVIIENEGEQTYIESHCTRYYWIGLHRLNYYAGWLWMDKTKPIYWKPGTWKSDTYNNRCMKTSFSAWLTTNCDSKNRHICECKAIA